MVSKQVTLLLLHISVAAAKVSLQFEDVTGAPLTGITLDGDYEFGAWDSWVSDKARFDLDGGGLFADGANIGHCSTFVSDGGSIQLYGQLECSDASAHVNVSGVLNSAGAISLGRSSVLDVRCPLVIQGSVKLADDATLKSLPAYTTCYGQRVDGSLSVAAYSQFVVMGNLAVQEGASLVIVAPRAQVYAIATVTVETGGRLEVTDSVAIVDAITVYKNECKAISPTGEVADCAPSAASNSNEIVPPRPKFRKLRTLKNTDDMGVQFGYGLETSECMLKATADHNNGNLVIPNLNGGNQRVSLGFVKENNAVFFQGHFLVANSYSAAFATIGASATLVVRPGSLLYWRNKLTINPSVTVELDNSASVAVLSDDFNFAASQTFHDKHIVVCGDSCPQS